MSATVRDSDFGEYIDIGPVGGDAIIVAVTYPDGRRPVRLLLPHQLYLDDARELMADPGATRIEVARIKSSEWIDVTAQVLGLTVVES